MANKFMTEEIIKDLKDTRRKYMEERIRSMHEVGYTNQEIAETLSIPQGEIRKLWIE